ARGRKQEHYLSKKKLMVNFQSITPQGDGNGCKAFLLSLCSSFQSITPQGDGNHRLIRSNG
ncbi:MAG: hypothetical protein AAFV90_30525, partial [Cyanobacteria bacterium J06634_5]